MNTWWLVSCESVDGGDPYGRIEAPFASQAAKKFAELGARGLAVIENEQTNERTVWRLHATMIHYAYPER